MTLKLTVSLKDCAGASLLSVIELVKTTACVPTSAFRLVATVIAIGAGVLLWMKLWAAVAMVHE